MLGFVCKRLGGGSFHSLSGYFLDEALLILFL